MAENLITIGMILGVSPVLAAVLSDAFDTFEEGCVRMLYIQVIIWYCVNYLWCWCYVGW